MIRAQQNVSAAPTPYLQVCPGLAPRSAQAGFTIVEMIVAMAIIALISAAVMFQWTKFDSQLLLKNMAYEIALGVRQAQSLGISTQGGNAGDFQKSYGVHFTLGKSYTLFRDSNGDGNYDSSPVDEGITTFTITGKNSIEDLCVNATCGKAALDLVFVRPDPDAHIYSSPSTANASEARVILGSDISGNTQTVSVSVTGQISIE